MDIRHLKIFIAVAETGSMSGAAKQFFVTQPSVSQVIKELESHFGVLLFERLGKRLFITDSGRYLSRQARIVIRQFDELEESMLNAGRTESVRVGSTITVGACLLSSLMADFKKSNPEIKTFNYVNNTKMIEERLLRAELDIALVEGQIKHPDLVIKPVIADYLVIVCGRRHRFAGQQQIKIKELEKEVFIMREKGSGTRKLFMDFIEKNGFNLNIGWEVTSPEIIKTIVMKNNCLAAISIRLVEEEAQNGDIYVIKHNEHSWNRTFSLVYHKNKHISKGMLGFMNVTQAYGNTGIITDVPVGMLI
ncbi:LysR family transcriptional regulator [Acetobacterium bakii]|uniref:MarR family transcriptional regulator n=1 Tax=Acetobacterium bakii TaxID=52689 RepID=A0A0L6TXL1_9FIRM|nr:LysR family transcriptional regulator [Acetobacterium bakii]KNZ40305.1 MarR family transcriptional regulator [Acetobacterium bakii]